MPHHDHHFGGDKFADLGLWSPPTSAANCEEDYAVTWYIAEFVNCISSFAYVYYAFGPRAIPSAKPSNAAASAGRRAGAAPRLDFLSVAMCLVGVCSAAFHATLRQGAQFSDDLSMLLLAGGLLRRLYTYGQTPRVASLISAVVFLGTLVVSIIYVRSGAIIIHFTTFSVQCHLIWPRTLYLIHRHGQRGHPAPSSSSSSPYPSRDKSPSSRASRPTTSLQRRFWRAAGILVLAFAVWNVDLEACAALRSARDALGLPWAWLLELHGWWHVLTAVGAMEYVALVRTLCEEGG